MPTTFFALSPSFQKEEAQVTLPPLEEFEKRNTFHSPTGTAQRSLGPEIAIELA
jgi:hypothetical protein